MIITDIYDWSLPLAMTTAVKSKIDILLDICDKLDLPFNANMINIMIDMLDGGMSVDNLLIILEEMRVEVS